MLFKLTLKTIRDKKFRSILASLSITIGTASLIIFLGLANGIRTATFLEMEKSKPLTQITVRPDTSKSGMISFLAGTNKDALSDITIENISKIDGVKKIFPETQFNQFASIEAKILGFSLITDAMVFGLDKEFVLNDLKNPDSWNRTIEPYPAIIPRKLLDIYNLSIATPQGLPTLSEEGLLGKELIFYPNYSSFFPSMNKKTDEIKLEVVGFSDKVNLIGATLPSGVLNSLNEKYAPDSQKVFIELYVETETAEKTPIVAGEIEKLGLKTQYYQKDQEGVEAKFQYLTISLGAISMIILLTSAIAIISTFLATIAERTKEIGLYRALGATKTHIKKLILTEAGIIGLIGSITGIIIGILGSKIIDIYGIQQLASTTFKPETIFNIDYKLITFTLIFGTLLSILAAYIPAQKASKINPITALSK